MDDRKPLPNSVCEYCEARNTLVVDVTAVEGKKGVDEIAIVCTACETHTHVRYTSKRLRLIEEKVDREMHPGRKAKERRRLIHARARLQKEMAATSGAGVSDGVA